MSPVLRPSQGVERRATPRARTVRSAFSYLAPVLLSVSLLSACAGGDAGSISAPTVDAEAKRAPVPPPPAPPTAPSSGVANILSGATFWVNPTSNARTTADGWRASRPADAASMDKVAAGAQVSWIGNWNTNVRTDVNNAVLAMGGTGAVPVFVAYNIPQRDCGGLSGGNTTTIAAYRTWIADFAAGIGGRRAAVVLEPDALANMDCLSAADQQTRIDLLSYAVATFRALGSTAVYLDAGNPKWKPAATMADRLTRAGVANANGFSLNVSNFITTSDNVAYGTQLSGLVGGKHFIIDTGRNGAGPTADAQWCNPAGRALGVKPTSATGNALVDAYLWIKSPGESDGACNGAPAAGAWMPDYALGLAQRASF